MLKYLLLCLISVSAFAGESDAPSPDVGVTRIYECIATGSSYYCVLVFDSSNVSPDPYDIHLAEVLAAQEAAQTGQFVLIDVGQNNNMTHGRSAGCYNIDGGIGGGAQSIVRCDHL